jgi:hypothetical protein
MSTRYRCRRATFVQAVVFAGLAVLAADGSRCVPTLILAMAYFACLRFSAIGVELS